MTENALLKGIVSMVITKIHGKAKMTEGEEKEGLEKEGKLENSSALSKEEGAERHDGTVGFADEEEGTVQDRESSVEENERGEVDADDRTGLNCVTGEAQSGEMCESSKEQVGEETGRNEQPVGGKKAELKREGTEEREEGSSQAVGGQDSIVAAMEETMFSDVTLSFMTGVAAMRNIFSSLSDIPENMRSPSQDLPPSLSLPTTCSETSPVSHPSPVTATFPLYLPTVYVTPSCSSPAAPPAAPSASWSSRVRHLVRKFSVGGGMGLLGNAGRLLNRLVLKKSKSLPDAPVFYHEGVGEGEGAACEDVFEAEARGGGGSERKEDKEEGEVTMSREGGWVRKRVSEIERLMRERLLEHKYLEEERTRRHSCKDAISSDNGGFRVRTGSICQEEESTRKDIVLLEKEKGVCMKEEEMRKWVDEKSQQGESKEAEINECTRKEMNSDGYVEKEQETIGCIEEEQETGQAKKEPKEKPKEELQVEEAERESSEEAEIANSEETLSEDGSEEDTNDEDDEEEAPPQVELRGQLRPRPSSLYRYSSVRPRTIIMGLG